MHKVIVPLGDLLHQPQREVLGNDARFRVVAAGRRWRKTSLGVIAALLTALDGGRAWHIFPSYPMSQVGWRMLRGLARQLPDRAIREGDRLITLPSGGMAQIKSASDPDSLRGEGLDLAILDEAALIRERAWIEAIRPALSDKLGRALFLGTPKGRNWFWHLWQSAQSSPNGEWASFRFATSTNPFILPSEIEAAKQMLPDRIFRQEYDAEFIQEGSGVFRKVVEAATAEPQGEGRPGHHYVFGVDWGKHNDFTVIHVIDATEGAQVATDRFNQIDYTLQTARLRALYDRFVPNTVVAERNAMGEPIIERLLAEGLPITPFTTTNASKKMAIESLAAAFETSELRILADPILIGELQAYETERLPSGMLRYSAPPGMHDDCVMALAMAWQGMGSTEPMLRWL